MKKAIYMLLFAAVLGLSACSDKKDKDSSEDDMDSLTMVVDADQVA
jgi:protein involved in sex pheromone biosynthesis